MKLFQILKLSMVMIIIINKKIIKKNKFKNFQINNFEKKFE